MGTPWLAGATHARQGSDRNWQQRFSIGGGGDALGRAPLFQQLLPTPWIALVQHLQARDAVHPEVAVAGAMLAPCRHHALLLEEAEGEGPDDALRRRAGRVAVLQLQLALAPDGTP